jgi:hypothetical protein
MPGKWKYKIKPMPITVNGQGEAASMEIALNTEGELGWEAIGILTRADGETFYPAGPKPTPHYFVIMKQKQS